MRVLVANNFRVYPLFSQQAAKVCQCYRHCFVPAVRLSCGLRECSSSAAVGHLKTNAVSGGRYRGDRLKVSLTLKASGNWGNWGELGDRREVPLTLLMDFRSERRKTSGNLGRTWRRECLRLGPRRRVSNPRNEPSSFDSGLMRPDESRLR